MKWNYLKAYAELLESPENPDNVFYRLQDYHNQLNESNPEWVELFMQIIQEKYETAIKKAKLIEVIEYYNARVERIENERRQKIEEAKERYRNKVGRILKNPIQAILAPIDLAEEMEKINTWYSNEIEREKKWIIEMLGKGN